MSATGSKELAQQVLRNSTIRKAGLALLTVGAAVTALTSAESIGTVISDTLSGHALSWDLLNVPLVSLAATTFSQFPVFVSNNHTVAMAREEDSTLAEQVKKASHWRNAKRGSEVAALVLTPTFIPGGIPGGIAVGGGLLSALVARTGEGVYNGEAARTARKILAPQKQPRRVVSAA